MGHININYFLHFSVWESIRRIRTYQKRCGDRLCSQFLKNKNIKGIGLFASRKLHKGEVIVEYLGKILSDKQAEQKQKTNNKRQCLM